jgi:hypothetical protein
MQEAMKRKVAVQYIVDGLDVGNAIGRHKGNEAHPARRRGMKQHAGSKMKWRDRHG